MALAWIAGTWFGLSFEIKPGIVSATVVQLLVLWTIAQTAHRKGYASSAIPAITLFFACGAIATLNAALHSRDWNGAESCPLAGHFVDGRGDMVGVISDDPIPLPGRHAQTSWSFTLDLEQIRENTNDAWRAIAGAVEVRLYNTPPRGQPAYGERWQMNNVRLTSWARQDGGPNMERVTAYTHPGDADGTIRLARGFGNPFFAFCYRGRKAAGTLLTSGIENRPGAMRIINAMLLGYRRQMGAAIYHDFTATSTLHIFAISGSHVVVLAGIVIVILMALNIPRTHWFYALGPILILFTAATGMEPSAVRACIMAIAFWGAVPLKRRPDIYSALGLAAILLLAWNPGDLTNLGFILSFTTVLGLAVLFEPLSRRIMPPPRDPLALPGPIPTWIRVRAAFLKLVVSCIAAWLVSTPLTAYYFNTFSPVALAGNLVAIPLAFMIMLTGCLSLLAGVLWQWPGMIFNHANAVFADLLAWSMRCFATLPGGHWQVDSAPVWLIAAYFICIGFLARKLAVKTS